jgi:formylglycine-generating enzyme required for sulfatase activity
MGTLKKDREASDNDKPQHSVTLPGFYISRYPLTNTQYRPFVEGGGYDEPGYWTEEGWSWRTGQHEWEGISCAITPRSVIT